MQNFALKLQFSLSVVSDSLQPHEPQHARPPCPSPTPGVYSNPYPLSRWCHPTISSSVTLFSSSPQPSRESGSFPISRLFASGGQSIGASASAFIQLRYVRNCEKDVMVWKSSKPEDMEYYFLNLGLVALQCCVSFCSTAKWISYTYTWGYGLLWG